MDTVKVYGPPGTGKTHSACQWLEWQVSQGADPERVAFVSFTNAACDEARDRVCTRLGLFPYEVPFCATIHALCRRALRIEGRDWLAEGKWMKEWAKSAGFDLVPTRKSAGEDMDEVAKSGGEDAILLQIWNFGRSRLIADAASAWRAFEAYDPEAIERADYKRYLAFVTKYEADKTQAFKLDYTDLLWRVVKTRVSLPVSVVCVDESQDMTPLLWAAADVLFVNAEVRACLADDDQAIYGYQGSDPDLFNGRPAEKSVTLSQSRRLPERVFSLAQRIIRQNKKRTEKLFHPVTPEIVLGRADRQPGPATRDELVGQVRRVRSARSLDLLNGESWMILARNWAFVPEVASELESNGVPYRIQGEAYYSPWSDKGPLRAAKAVMSLSQPDGRVDVASLACLVEKTRSARGDVPGAWTYGSKAKIKAWTDERPDAKVGLLDLVSLGLTEWGFDRIVLRDLSILDGISDRDKQAYAASIRRGTWGQDARIRVSTIHGVKGQEADNVAALMACTRAPARNLERPDRREEEIRLAYVAVTRARKRFFGVECEWGQSYEVFHV